MSPRAGLKYQAKVIKEPKDDSWKLEILDRVLQVNSVTNSVPDPHVSGPPGSTSQRLCFGSVLIFYGSGSRG